MLNISLYSYGSLNIFWDKCLFKSFSHFNSNSFTHFMIELKMVFLCGKQDFMYSRLALKLLCSKMNWNFCFLSIRILPSWRSHPGPQTCWASTLPTDPYPQSCKCSLYSLGTCQIYGLQVLSPILWFFFLADGSSMQEV